MNGIGDREVEHQINVNALASEVYRLITEVKDWPRLFPPTVYVDYIERSAKWDRIRIWATANGKVKNWISYRALDAAQLRIEFHQEVSAPPVAAMGGTWLIEPISESESLVRLRHHYRAVDDDPNHLAWIEQAVDRNSRSELAALKANLEMATSAGDKLMFSFADTVAIKGAAEDVYDFLNDAQLWQERLPHVARIVLTEDSPGVQVLEMDTLTKDGATHTTKSVRICFPYRKIVYKQISLPALMTLHTGYWLLTEDPTDKGAGLAVTSQHTVVINEANISRVISPDVGVAHARDFIHDALSTNSLATLERAKEFAEGRW